MSEIVSESALLLRSYELEIRSEVWPILPIITADLETGSILYCTKSGANTFGYEPGELAGRQLELLVPAALFDAHAGWRRDMGATPRMRLMGEGRLVTGRKKSGESFPAHVGITAMRLEVSPARLLGVALVIDLTGAALASAAKET